ncbi:MAG: LuxR C-terminal-related transcriptional regulator [Terriglobales bacterium]|jgi:two-component system, NarL family, response regulator NreC
MPNGARKHVAERKRISVLVAEDALVIRRALRKMLEELTELSVVGDSSIRELVNHASRLQPDVVLINVVDPTLKHVELTKSLRQLPKSPEVILMSQYKHPEFIRAFFEAGGGGCLVTEVDNSTLVAAVRRVAAGRKYIDSNVSDEAVVAMVGGGGRPRAILSPREREVLRFLALGYTYKDTAKAMGISVASVETYRARIIEKLDLRGRADLIRYALLSGILHPEDESSAA